jgi:hypothetical protein
MTYQSLGTAPYTELVNVPYVRFHVVTEQRSRQSGAGSTRRLNPNN